MFALIVSYGGVYDWGKISPDYSSLVEKAKSVFNENFDPEVNDCIIIDFDGNIVFSYEYDVYFKEVV